MGLKQFRLARQRLKHEISGKRMPHQELAADIGRKLLLYIRKQILRQKAKETGLTAIGVSRIITADRICRCCREIEIAPRLIIGLRPGIAYADDDRGRNAGCFRPSGARLTVSDTVTKSALPSRTKMTGKPPVGT